MEFCLKMFSVRDHRQSRYVRGREREPERERERKRSPVFSGFFSMERRESERAGPVMRPRYHTDGRPCRIWRDGSPREYEQQHDQQWCSTVRMCACVRACVWIGCTRSSLLLLLLLILLLFFLEPETRDAPRISEGAIFETSSRRARDL